VLFEQAQKAIKGSSYAEARSLLETLINTHPDSEYVPRAKLSIADSWYSERAFKQAELEYRDFITFFPNRPEVAEAQHRIDSIHQNARF
jgi:outer membrane protein assembly factor BamD